MLGWGFGTLVFGSVSPSLPTAGLPGQPSDEANGVGGNAQPGLAVSKPQPSPGLRPQERMPSWPHDWT